MYVVVTNEEHQLGNCLCLFANVIASAMDSGQTVVNPSFYKYAEFFQATRGDFFCRYPHKASLLPGKKPLMRIFYVLVLRFTQVLMKLKLKCRYLRVVETKYQEQVWLDGPDFQRQSIKTTVFLGYYFRFQSIESFDKHADAIRRFFTPVGEYRRNVSNLMGALRKSSDIVVGVHIRHGDYKRFMGGKFFHKVEDYVALMRKIRDLFPEKKVGFLIVSNENQNPNHFSTFNHALGTGHMIEDLYSLAQCDYILGPPSTYSWWASFYGKVPLYLFTDPNAKISLDCFQSPYHYGLF